MGSVSTKKYNRIKHANSEIWDVINEDLHNGDCIILNDQLSEMFNPADATFKYVVAEFGDYVFIIQAEK